MRTWKEYWSKCPVDEQKGLSAMMKFAGWHDEGSVIYASVEAWYDYLKKVEEILEIKNGDTIYDVGCGAGASIYHFYQKGYAVAGCDVCSNFIKVAKEHMPRGEFLLCEAGDIDTTNKYDYVISMGVFTTFSDLTYAEIVIKKMVEKARKAIAILDLNDISKVDEYRKVLAKQYGKFHLYYERGRDADEIRWAETAERAIYSKSWFYDLGERLGVNTTIIPQFLGTEVGKFRFNVFMRK